MVAEGQSQYHYDEDGNIQCKKHPLKNNSNPGGICGLCLQDKLTNLVSSSSSSSFPIPVFPSSSSSPSSPTTASPPSFRSQSSAAITNDHSLFHPTRNPFFLSQKKKSKDHRFNNNPPVLKRSKSTATRISYFNKVNDDDVDTPRRKGFWGFLMKKSRNEICYAQSGLGQNGVQGKKEKMSYVVVEENDSPDRRVSRSRSVGCGSRSFSGDLFERISTGFGDCTLRRVESHREGKGKMGSCSNGGQDSVKGRVKCGGIFRGLMVASSSSSSSSSSSYRVSSSTEDGKIPAVAGLATVGHRTSSRSWGWAFASPLRGFSKPPSAAATAVAAAKNEPSNSNKNITPNLNAIPSILTVGG